jgi:hypothetical protein
LIMKETSIQFCPPQSIWINCRNFTYTTHTNECGPRMLLALTILLTHPAPHRDMLIPYMHPNLAQIARTHVAMTILTGRIVLPDMLNDNTQVSSCMTTVISNPASLIKWPSLNKEGTQLSRADTRLYSSLDSHSHSPESSSPASTHTIPTTQSENFASILKYDPFPKQKKRSAKRNPTTGKQPTPSQRTLGQFFPSINHTRSPSQTLITTFLQMNEKPLTRASPDSPYTNPSGRPTQRLISNKAAPDKEIHITPASIVRKAKHTIVPKLNTNRKIPANIHPLCPTDQGWGHSLENIDTSTILRVILQNPNGLKLQSSYEDFILGM